MNKRILFARKLRTRLDKILEDEGFEVAEFFEHPFENLVYKRQNSNAKLPDSVIFLGPKTGYPNTILASAHKHEGGRFNIRLKELHPDYLSLPVSEFDRWNFDSIDELDAILKEITDIIVSRLLPWFENPINRPGGEWSSGIEMKLTDEEMIEKLEELIYITELALARYIEQGNSKPIQIEEEALIHYRSQLADLTK